MHAYIHSYPRNIRVQVEYENARKQRLMEAQLHNPCLKIPPIR